METTIMGYIRESAEDQGLEFSSFQLPIRPQCGLGKINYLTSKVSLRAYNREV